MSFKEEINYIFDASIKYASAFGSPFFVAFTIAVFFALNQSSFAYRLLILSVSFMIIEYVIKAITDNKRPDFKINKTKSAIGKFEEKHSFPSGHAGHIAILATLINLVYHNTFLTSIFALLMILVGLSRIYTKRHRTRDVIAGYLIGIVMTVLSFYLF